MAVLALAALLLGILCGVLKLDNFVISLISSNSDIILSILMFSVGISVGLNRGLIEKLKKYHVKILLIPSGIILASVLGGVICSLLTGYSFRESTAVASGLGWYSLAGVTIGELAGAELGSIAFLSNLMRELFSFFSIPYISRRFNYYSCIAVAGATSEDTTLPMMIKYTSEEVVVLSVLNGIICSALVPVMIAFCFQGFV